MSGADWYIELIAPTFFAVKYMDLLILLVIRSHLAVYPKNKPSIIILGKPSTWFPLEETSPASVKLHGDRKHVCQKFHPTRLLFLFLIKPTSYKIFRLFLQIFFVNVTHWLERGGHLWYVLAFSLTVEDIWRTFGGLTCHSVRHCGWW
jgi:hypothetical protein